MKRNRERLYGLDMLRMFLALLVFCFHSRMHIGCSFGILNSFIEMGAIAMTAFFLLSGFVLHGVYGAVDMTGWPQYRHFILKRIINLWPCAVAVGAASIVMATCSGGGGGWRLWALVPIEILGIGSIYDSLFNIPPNGGLWFVSCIFICYLLYPALAKIVQQMSTCEVVMFMMGLIVVLLFSPLVVRVYHCQPIYSSPIFRFMEFCIGVTLQRCCSKWCAVKSTSVMLWIIALGGAAFLVSSVSLLRAMNVLPEDYMMYSVVGLPSFALIIISLAKIGFKGSDQSRLGLVRYCGNLMYAFFLCQLCCFKIVKWFRLGSNCSKLFVSFALCVAGSVIMHEVLQKRFGRAIRCMLCSDGKDDK